MPHTHSIPEIRRAITGRQRSAEETARAALAAIHERDPALHAFLQVFDDAAITQARAVDARLAAGDPVGPLAGVPIALKDNICLDHGRTTCASRILENYESPFTATAAARLIAAGAIILGKTNLDEFAMGSSTELSAFGPTANPWDHTRVPGGSSGGSAAAVADGLVPLALGSDTGGSVRQPAALCGVVGLKPTYGRVSRYGLVAYASSLDQIGTLAASVHDAALALSIIAGPDPQDSTSSARPAPSFPDDQPLPVNPVIGVPRELRGPAAAGLHPAVRDALEHAIRALSAHGAAIVEIDLPHAEHAIAAYYLVACAEASSNLARFDGVRFGRRASLAPGQGLADLYASSRSQGLGPEVQRRIMLGTYALSSGYYDAFYAQAMRARRLIKSDFDRAFAPSSSHGSACHAILMPTTPSPAFKRGEKLTDPLALYLEDVFTVGVNLAGLPALSVPWSLATVDGSRLPVGLQLIAQAFDEPTLVSLGRLLEHLRGPALHP